jgi:predicted lipid-binding transport protein (Tim44 family)
MPVSDIPFDIDILLLLAVAAFLFLRLRGVLGKRTGNERPRSNPYTERGSSDQSGERVIPLPDRGGQSEVRPRPQAEPEPYAPADSPLGRGIAEIQAADPAFDPHAFLDGAKAAFEAIVGAFAAGDSKALKSLLSPPVYSDFANAIEARKQAGETLETTVIGFDRAEITNAVLQDREAQVTVEFVTEQINLTKNADGAITEGDPQTVSKVTDIWTFARDTRSRDPNWQLVETRSGD